MKKEQPSLYEYDEGEDDDGFDRPHLMEESPSPIVSDITVGLALPHQHLDLQIALLCFLDLYIYTNKYPDVKQLSCPSLTALAQPLGSVFFGKYLLYVGVHCPFGIKSYFGNAHLDR